MPNTTHPVRDFSSHFLGAGLTHIGTPTPSELRCVASPAPGDGTIKIEDDAHDKPSALAVSNTPTRDPSLDRSAFPKRTFEEQRSKDRRAAKNAIEKRIASLEKSGKWGRLNVEGRKLAVLERYDALIEMRGRHAIWWSARQMFPTAHDEGVERQWVLETFEKSFEPELQNAKAQKAAQKVTSYAEEESDDEEPEGEDTIAVKTEGLARAAVEAGQQEGRGSEEEAALEEKMQEIESKLNALKKRKSEGGEQREAKKAKTHDRNESASLEDELMSVENEEEEVIYVAVSSGMAICNISKAQRDRGVGWPWAKKDKAGTLLSKTR